MNCRDVAFIEALNESRKRRKKHKCTILKNKKVNIFKQIIDKINYIMLRRD